MKTKQQKYNSPKITRIVLDNAISLILASDAPVGPDELSIAKSQENFNQEFFRG